MRWAWIAGMLIAMHVPGCVSTTPPGCRQDINEIPTNTYGDGSVAWDVHLKDVLDGTPIDGYLIVAILQPSRPDEGYTSWDTHLAFNECLIALSVTDGGIASFHLGPGDYAFATSLQDSQTYAYGGYARELVPDVSVRVDGSIVLEVQPVKFDRRGTAEITGAGLGREVLASIEVLPPADGWTHAVVDADMALRWNNTESSWGDLQMAWVVNGSRISEGNYESYGEWNDGPNELWFAPHWEEAFLEHRCVIEAEGLWLDVWAEEQAVASPVTPLEFQWNFVGWSRAFDEAPHGPCV